MMESPYVTVNRVLSEPVNAADDLRIIATSGTKLDRPTREIVANAAEELEATQRLLIATQQALSESLHIRAALTERLSEVYREPGIGLVIPGPLSMTYAPLKVIPNQ